MIFLKYKQPKAEYVQFQRLVLGVLMLIAVLSQRVEFLYAFVMLSSIGFITTTSYSPTTMLFKLFHYLFGKPLFTTAPQYAHSYITYRLAEIFEDLMRIAFGLLVLYLFDYVPLVSWMMASFMGIAMLVSGLFGFCFSSLVYIGYQKLLQKMDLVDE
jgi:hypothetical protein